MKFRYFQIIALLIFFINLANAQITFSPYTHFAAGQVEQGGSGANHAMGGTGIAFRSGRSLNNINPASYCGIDSLSFLFDIGVFGKYTTFYDGTNTENRYSGNLKYIAIGARLFKWWAASFGIAPYSSVSYTINTKDDVEGGTSTYDKKFKGSGGITQYYFGNAFTPIKNLSLGVNFSYLLGTIEQTETVTAAGVFPQFEIKKTNSLSNFIIDFGTQYKINYNNNNFTIGAIYGYENSLNTNTSVTLTNYSDTIPLEHSDETFLIPQKYGVGFAFEKPNRLRVGFDYERREWSSLKFNNPNLKTRNSDRFSVGVEYTPIKSMHDGGLLRWYYRMGLNYNRSYLVIDKTPINSMALTLGVGIPLKRQLTSMNVSFEIGQNGTTEKHLIQETYYMVHLNFALQDFWFFKPKYD